MKKLEQVVDRATNLVGTFGATGSTPANVDAETLVLPRCLLIHQTLELLIKFCYVQAVPGIFTNLEGNTVIPKGVYCPFSHAGKPRKAKGTRANLTRTERDVVRFWLKALKRNRQFPLFFYEEDSRRWHVDTLRYETEQGALTWLEKNKLAPNAFLTYKHHLRAKR